MILFPSYLIKIMSIQPTEDALDIFKEITIEEGTSELLEKNYLYF